MKRLTLSLIAFCLLIVGCSSLSFRVAPKYEATDAQMAYTTLKGDKGVGSGVMFGPGFELYLQGYQVLGLGYLGVSGASSVEEAARLTAVPVFGLVSFYNGTITPWVGYRTTQDDEWLFGLSTSIGNIFKPRKKLDEPKE